MLTVSQGEPNLSTQNDRKLQFYTERVKGYSYVESQIQVPFIRGVGAALNKTFGAGAFDWGHYTLT